MYSLVATLNVGGGSAVNFLRSRFRFHRCNCITPLRRRINVRLKLARCFCSAASRAAATEIAGKESSLHFAITIMTVSEHLSSR